jgi:predicted nucleic acid-binding protein
MSAKYFLDTNIFVYAVHPLPSEKSEIATELISRGLDDGTGVISYQVIQEFFSLAFRKFRQPMSAFDAEAYLNTIFRPLLSVPSSTALFVSALQIYEHNRFSWYDCLIVAAAAQSECSILYTEDLQDGQRVGNLKIKNPFL